MNDTPSPRTTLRAVESSKPVKKSATRPTAGENEVPLDTRLKTSSDAVNEAYATWSKKKGEKEREALQETMHELRRALAALEITIAMSDRD